MEKEINRQIIIDDIMEKPFGFECKSYDLAFVFIPKAIMELMGLCKGQKVDVRVVDEKIVIAPVTALDDFCNISIYKNSNYIIQ